MTRSEARSRRFPAVAWIATALPLALVWLVLLLTGAVSDGVLTAIGIAIVVLALFVSLRANYRLRRR